MFRPTVRVIEHIPFYLAGTVRQRVLGLVVPLSGVSDVNALIRLDAKPAVFSHPLTPWYSYEYSTVGAAAFTIFTYSATPPQRLPHQRPLM